MDTDHDLLFTRFLHSTRSRLEFYPSPLSQHIKRFRKRKILVTGEKRENISACIAAKTVENLPFRVDVK